MIITAHAFARAGLVGNPSDGYFGKTISFVIRNFRATVQLWESPHFEILPTHGDLARFDNVASFIRDIKLNGYYGGLQMNLGFQQTYAPWLLRTKGTADHWTPLEQMWTAEKAAKSRGFYPWPNTARFCGLI